METDTFEADLRNGGYTEIATRSQDPNHATTPHTHPFDVRALVLDGEIMLTVDGKATRYAAGDVFTMANGCEHTETVGAAGVTTIAGRRYS